MEAETRETKEKPSEQRVEQPPTRDSEWEKRTRGYQRWEARASTVTRLLSEVHHFAHYILLATLKYISM